MGGTFFGKFPFEFIFFVEDDVLRVAFLDTFMMKPVHNSIIGLLRGSGLIHNDGGYFAAGFPFLNKWYL
jgi:hypothetical protein